MRLLRRAVSIRIWCSCQAMLHNLIATVKPCKPSETSWLSVHYKDLVTSKLHKNSSIKWQHPLTQHYPFAAAFGRAIRIRCMDQRWFGRRMHGFAQPRNQIRCSFPTVLNSLKTECKVFMLSQELYTAHSSVVRLFKVFQPSLVLQILTLLVRMSFVLAFPGKVQLFSSASV